MELLAIRKESPIKVELLVFVEASKVVYIEIFQSSKTFIEEFPNVFFAKLEIDGNA